VMHRRRADRTASAAHVFNDDRLAECIAHLDRVERAITSVPPPAGKELIKRTGLLG
jgi:hypothetical protein